MCARVILVDARLAHTCIPSCPIGTVSRDEVTGYFHFIVAWPIVNNGTSAATLRTFSGEFCCES